MGDVESWVELRDGGADGAALDALCDWVQRVVGNDCSRLKLRGGAEDAAGEGESREADFGQHLDKWYWGGGSVEEK